MDTLPLPPRADPDQYRKRAKDLVKAARSNDRDAVKSWAAAWLSALAIALELEPTPFVQHSMDRAVAHIAASVREKAVGARQAGGEFSLADAQFFIAQAHGFENWARFSSHVRRLPVANTPFEGAADAVVRGDLRALERLMQAHPELIHAHSERVHAATLLHYVAANGVEDFRQKTPPNAVAVARYLLDAGAEVDALADTYGRDRYQTTMNLLVSSAHPAGAGLQVQLAETLLDFGAAINGLDDDSSPLMTALAFGYGDAAEALARRGARIDNVIAAAALGRLALVDRFVINGTTLAPGVPLVGPVWFRVPDNALAHIALAFVWSCKFQHSDVAHLMLDRGVNPLAKDSNNMAALHWAAAGGLTNVVERLLKQDAPLEAENDWGGTVLNSTLHFALHDPRPGVDYAAIVQQLIDAGADVSVVDPVPTGDSRLDAVLKNGRGSRNN